MAFNSTIFHIIKCERLMCFFSGLNEIINIIFGWWFSDSFLYSIENYDFCTKFRPFLDTFPAKSPNCQAPGPGPGQGPGQGQCSSQKQTQN